VYLVRGKCTFLRMRVNVCDLKFVRSPVIDQGYFVSVIYRLISYVIFHCYLVGYFLKMVFRKSFVAVWRRDTTSVRLSRYTSIRGTRYVAASNNNSPWHLCAFDLRISPFSIKTKNTNDRIRKEKKGRITSIASLTHVDLMYVRNVTHIIL